MKKITLKERKEFWVVPYADAEGNVQHEHIFIPVYRDPITALNKVKKQCKEIGISPIGIPTSGGFVETVYMIDEDQFKKIAESETYDITVEGVVR